MTYRTLAKAVALISLCLFPFALSQVTISGPRSLDLNPGETRTVEYTITNTGEESVQAEVFYNDYAQMPDGSLVHIPAGSLPQSLFNLAQFERLEYVLPPQSSTTVPLQISVPADALGGYWGVVGVETPPPPTPEGQNAVSFNVRYAMVTAVDVSDQAQHAISIDNLTGQASAEGTSVVVTIRNAGTSYERYELDLTFESVTGASQTTSHSSVILPGMTVDLALPVPDDLTAGSYGVFATLAYREGARAEAVGTVTIE